MGEVADPAPSEVPVSCDQTRDSKTAGKRERNGRKGEGGREVSSWLTRARIAMSCPQTSQAIIWHHTVLNKIWEAWGQIKFVLAPF